MYKEKKCLNCKTRYKPTSGFSKYCLNKVRIRFKILKKYNFTCQYCGRKAPDVILHIDHINPKSKGGLNNEDNLTVACEDCNLGKSNIY